MEHMQYTVKSAHAVTSIKQSPVLKGHLFLFPSWKISYELNLFKRSPVLKERFVFVPKVTS
jgi:hypothetical protein